MRKLRIAGILFVTGLLVLEIGVRILGLADVPIRNANKTTGYIPQPSQSGRFLLNEWKINGLSMISSEEYLDEGNEIILAGDSVVFGGNPLDQEERIGERLNNMLSQPVYAIADGSWSLKNELSYFLHSDGIEKPQAIVFLLNSQDFSGPSSWLCQSSHPTSKPFVHTYFVYRKYFNLDCEEHTPAYARVDDFDSNTALNALVARFPVTRFKLFLYQNRVEFAEEKSLMDLVSGFDQVINGRIEVKELLEYSGKDMWHDGYYLDGIHPTADGAAVLAKILHLFITQSQ